MFGIIDKIQLQPQFVDDEISDSDISVQVLGGNACRKPISRTQKLYTLAGFVRGTSVIDIRTVTTDTLKRSSEALETIERAAKIQV